MNPVGWLRLGLGLPVAFASAGCFVPATRYEEARSALLVEQEAHRRTQARLVAVSRDHDKLDAQLGEREKRIHQLEIDLAEARLGSEIAASERKFAVELVEQLRGELGRTGDHLRVFADDKRKLAAALEAAELRAKRLEQCEQTATDNALIVRDTALALHEPIANGELELVLLDGKAALRIASSELVGETPEPLGQRVLATLARVALAHPDARLEIREEGATGTDGEVATARVKRVADRLGAHGLSADRVALVPSAGGNGEPTLQITIYVAELGAAPEEPKSES
jgi:hypothetical protein